MFRIVVKKLFNNKWLFLSLLIGMIMTIAMITAIPLYTEGVLQRMLVKDMENYQKETGEFPGTLRYEANYKFIADEQKKTSAYVYFNKVITGENLSEYNTPTLSKHYYNELTPFPIKRGEGGISSRKECYLSLAGIYNLGKQVSIENGKMYAVHKSEDVYEAIATKTAMIKNELQLNKVYELNITSEKSIRFEIVGIYKPLDNKDAFWFENSTESEDRILIDFELLYSDFIRDSGINLMRSVWNYSFDYKLIDVTQIDDLVNSYNAHEKWTQKNNTVLKMTFPVINTIEKYDSRQKELKMTLLILLTPVLIILTLFIFMISQFIVKNDANEIAVLRSRGSSRKKILLIYLYESILLSLVALIFGIPLGYIVTNILGSANGFLEFVNRVALPLRFNISILIYNLFAILFLLVTLMIPVIIYTKVSIVTHKQLSVRRHKPPIWKRLYIDIVLLALALYALYRYNNQQATLKVTGAEGLDIAIDPLIFLASTFFILGLGLLFIRLYPYLINFIFLVRKKSWSPTSYVSFLQISRTRGLEQFLMIFMIFVLAIGIFSANSARTINKNIEDKLYYSIGADITVMPLWKDNQVEAPTNNLDTLNNLDLSGITSDDSLRYTEPFMGDYKGLDGVDSVTKVYKTNQGTVVSGNNWIEDVNVMGVIPAEFGRISWFRNDLLPYHINGYLNILSKNNKALLLSSEFKDKYKIQLGDSISLELQDGLYVEGIVSAFIDYWTTFNPNKMKDSDLTKPLLVVGNLKYMQSSTIVLPYEIWLSKKEGVSNQVIYDSIKANDLEIIRLDNSELELLKRKNDPMLQGINGSLTIGFLFTMLLSFIGFLIYWIIAIKNRVLQFGIYRAMGMPFRGILKILFIEQLFISIIAIVIGIIIGGITSDLFIPLLQILYSSINQVPPFEIVSSVKDYQKIYVLVGFMLVVGYFMIVKVVSKIQITKILKLGED